MDHHNNNDGELFSVAMQRAIKARFLHVDEDPRGRRRLFFENAGGSLRLKSAVEAFARIDAMPDCPERIHEMSLYLQEVQARGTEDLRVVLNAFGAVGGTVHASLTASSAMFEMVRAIAEHVPGDNMVTTVLEHPSAFDAMRLYATRQGVDLRVARSNPATGGIDVDAVLSLVDAGTKVLSVMYASNISGAKIDVEAIVRGARAIKPDLYIVVDAVQHAPHGLIDLQRLPIDGINIAPYKFFGCRGSGFAWLSERAAVLPHHKLAAKRPDFWDLGSPAPWQFAVMTEIVDYVCWVGDEAAQVPAGATRRERFAAGMARIELHERALLARLLEGSAAAPGLRHLPGVKVLLDHPDLASRDLILAIAFDHLDHTQAVREYERRGVIVYERVASSLYSVRMLESFGIGGAIRVSPLHCHGPEDVDRFLAITREMCAA